MLYESQGGNITMALTGESLITRPLSPFREEQFLKLVEMLRNADITFTNAETLFHDYEGSPGIEHGGTWMRSDPSLIRELKWAGIDICATAMNHCYDFGETGVMVNIANMKKFCMPYAGTGENLALARAPGYLDTPKGRVALLAASDHCDVPGGRAVDQRPDVKGKPGANLIRVEQVCTVDRQAFNEMKRINEALGFEAAKRARLQDRNPQDRDVDTDTLFHFGPGESQMKICPGNGFRRSTVLDQRDLFENLKWIRDARRMADWVLYSFHWLQGVSSEDPADHLIELAHATIDAGADTFIGHGPHSDRGIEIYHGKPIFYSLGDFILQNDTVLYQPADAYYRYGLGLEATPADFYDVRSGKQTRGQDVELINWQSAIAVVKWEAGGLQEIHLHPIDLGMGLPMGQRGRPVLAQGEVARQILERLQQMSKRFDTTIRIENGCGVVSVA